MSALQYLQFQHPFGLLHQRFSVWDETLHGDEFHNHISISISSLIHRNSYTSTSSEEERYA